MTSFEAGIAYSKSRSFCLVIFCDVVSTVTLSPIHIIIPAGSINLLFQICKKFSQYILYVFIFKICLK